MKNIIYLLFLTMCSAKININIDTSNYLNKTKVKYTGNDFKLVTDEEVLIFNITKDNLNRGLRVELGRIPNDVFLRDPTPYEDLFKKYKWPQVARVLTVKRIKIIDFIKENVVLKTHELINNTTVGIKSKTDMKEEVENTIRTQWSQRGLPEDFIHYGINIEFGYGQWIFDAKWRDEELKSVHLPLEASKGTITVEPGQTIVSKLLATKIIILMEIEFEAKLVGNLIADYEQLYGKYHFWSPTLEKIMKAAELQNEILTKEVLIIRFYSDPKISVFDKDSGKELALEPKRRRWRKKGNYLFNLATKNSNNTKI